MAINSDPPIYICGYEFSGFRTSRILYDMVRAGDRKAMSHVLHCQVPILVSITLIDVTHTSIKLTFAEITLLASCGVRAKLTWKY